MASRTSPSRILALMRIHRIEFYAGYLITGWGSIIGAADEQALLRPATLCTFLLSAILRTAMHVLNSVVDVRTDPHDHAKTSISSAMGLLGRRTVLTIFWIEASLASLLAAGVAVLAHRPLVLVAALAFLTVLVLYNVEPVRLKRRGYANGIALGLSYGMLAAWLGFAAVESPATPGASWLLLSGIGIFMTALALWYSAPDAAADLAAGLATPVAHHGVTKILHVSSALLVLACVLLGWGFTTRYGPGWAFVGVAGVLACLFTNARLLYRVVRGVETGERWVPYWLVASAMALLIVIPSAHL